MLINPIKIFEDYFLNLNDLQIDIYFIKIYFNCIIFLLIDIENITFLYFYIGYLIGIINKSENTDMPIKDIFE